MILAGVLVRVTVQFCIMPVTLNVGIHTRQYLEDVLTRLPAMKASEAVCLTPANWLAARSAKAARPAA
jgi:hypothetical protein